MSIDLNELERRYPVSEPWKPKSKFDTETVYAVRHEELRSLLAAARDAERLRKALETIAGYDRHSKSVGICPYGCDTPSIARAALSRDGGG